MTSMSPSPNAKGMAFVAQLCEGKRLGGGGCWAVEPGQGLDDGGGGGREVLALKQPKDLRGLQNNSLIRYHWFFCILIISNDP